MAAPSTADATMGDAPTPDRASTPEVAVTTDSSDHGTPPPQTYNDSNYHFNHSTPGNTVYYNPTTVMDQLHITERQTTTAPPVPDNIPYTQFFTAFTLEEYQLLSQQQATPLAQLDYTRPIHCIPRDLRMPHYNSTLLSISLPEAANVHYYHTTSLHTTTGDNTNYFIIQLQIEQPLLLRYLASGQFLHFTRDYISYMMSVQHNYYLPTTTLAQTVLKVNYNMTTFTDNYSLRNNYVWNYHMPLLLPELLHYLYNRDQLHDFQRKAITTILCKSIQYYGFTLLTMTNLTQHHKALLHRFLRDYDQHMSCPEIDDERLRGAPLHDKLFHHQLLRDLGQSTTDGPSLPHPEMGTTFLSSCSTTTSACLHYFRPAPYIELEPEQRELLSAGHYFCQYSRSNEQQWFSSLLSIHVLHFS